MINEKFLSYVWQFGLYEPLKLQLSNGELLFIKQSGTLNKLAGPDFFNAKLQIGDTLWAGNVEIHVKSSDWLRHEHQNDLAYNNVILHVVWENDLPIYNAGGKEIPCLVLEGRVNPAVWQNYQHIAYSTQAIPCAKLLPHTDAFVLSNAIEYLAIERLAQKTIPLNLILQQNQNHWEATFYYLLARALGGKTNSEQMEQVAQSISFNILAKEKSDLLSLEALFLGQAGFLDDAYLGNAKDDYTNSLQRQYKHLAQKYSLKPMHYIAWKFGGLRPSNFPTLRLAQLAALVYKSNHLFSKIISIEKTDELLNLFSVQASEYWHKHYNLGKETAKSMPKKIGEPTLHLIAINTIAPLMLLYGTERDLPQLQEHALQLLSQLPAENNHIIDIWKNLKMSVKTALESQAFLQLYNEYCTPKRCLECRIGNHLLRNKYDFL